MPDHRPYRKWYMHRRDALRRGIPFLLSFEQWMHIWQESGHWRERGKKKGQYVMARPGDKGAYEEGNVKIILQEDNTREACVGKKATAETRAKMSVSRRKRPGHSQETITKIRESNIKTYQNPEIREKLVLAHMRRKMTDLEALAYALV